jgi:hypothetical protein
MKKKDKLTTLIVDDMNDLKAMLLDYDGDVEGIQLAPALGTGSTEGVLAALNNLTLFAVVAKPDPNLDGFDVNLDYYAVDPIIITDINLTKEDVIVFNGDIELPREVTEENQDVVGSYLVDEELAESLCREINEFTSKKVDALAAVLTKTQKFRREIASKSLS